MFAAIVQASLDLPSFNQVDLSSDGTSPNSKDLISVLKAEDTLSQNCTNYFKIYKIKLGDWTVSSASCFKMFLERKGSQTGTAICEWSRLVKGYPPSV